MKSAKGKKSKVKQSKKTKSPKGKKSEVKQSKKKKE